MSEARQLTILLVAIFIIGIAGVWLIQVVPSLLIGGVVVDDYTATFYLNGTLIEEFLYQVKQPNVFRMLFRSWDAPITTGTKLGQPYITVVKIDVPQGSFGYTRDYSGTVFVSPNASSYRGTIQNLANLNEVGCFSPSTFNVGTYKVRYVFQIHPPIEFDGSLAHLNLKLADVHLP